MPRKAPENAELVRLSTADAELLDFFSLRRDFEEDGSLRNVQLVGDPDLFVVAGRCEDLAAAHKKGKKKKIGSYQLGRMIAWRMLGRPLTSSEVVIPKNGLKGDMRRSNIEIATRSDQASVPRKSWSRTGVKYVYETAGGKYYAQIGELNLGTYDTKEEAAEAVDMFEELTSGGLSREVARTQVLNRHRNKDRVLIGD